jgi:hypothetical protein
VFRTQNRDCRGGSGEKAEQPAPEDVLKHESGENVSSVSPAWCLVNNRMVTVGDGTFTWARTDESNDFREVIATSRTRVKN